MTQASQDEKKEDGIKKVKIVYEEVMNQLLELEKDQKQVLDEEKKRIEEEKKDKIRQSISNNFKE